MYLVFQADKEPENIPPLQLSDVRETAVADAIQPTDATLPGGAYSNPCYTTGTCCPPAHHLFHASICSLI